MPRSRAPGIVAFVATLALAAVATAAVAVDGVVPMNGTALGEVHAGGKPAAIGVLVPAGTGKGSLTVKAAKGSLLAPRVALVAPDGTVKDQDALAALGAIVKVTPKSASVKNLPVFAATGLWKVLVTGGPGKDGKPTVGGFTVKLAGKPVAAFTAPPAAIANIAEKDDYAIEVPENALLSVTLKPDRATPFSATLKLLANTGDEIDYGPYSKVGTDDSITVKNMPLPAFGRFVLRVGSKAATGNYTLAAKYKASKKTTVAAGAPVADAGGPYVVEPNGKVTLDGSGTSGATSYLWIPVGTSTLAMNPKVPNPSLNALSGRGTYAWQLVARNNSGYSLPSLAILEVDRAPIADAGRGAAVVGGSVQLDGSASQDLDAGETLFYAWEQVSGPAATLDDAFAAKPAFVPAATGTYVFSLVVHDGILPSERSLAVVAFGSGAEADAGRVVVVRPQDSVFLSGLRSRKVDGTAPTQWAWSALPSNTAAVTLSGANGPVASFTAPKQPARLGFRLAVQGDAANADEVTVVVTNAIVPNGSPVANAGGPLAPALSAGFSLDGTASTDDGTIAAYEWMQADGADADLQQDAAAAASGTAPDAPGVLRFLLMVHDGRKYGAPDAAIVAVGTPGAPLASAGGNGAGSTGQTITLTSAASQPAPGQSLTSRQWTQLSGTDWYDVAAKDAGFNPSAASPVLAVPTTVSSLSADRTLLFGLTVTDSSGTSLQDLVAVVFQNLQKNASPQVSAGVSAPGFRPGSTVAMSATASDGDGDPLSFTWSQVSGPPATLNGATLANASVTAPDASGTLVYRVTVSDNTGEPNSTSFVDVSFFVNRPPVVVATSTPASGPDGTFVTLNGSTTTDPDDAGITFAWTETPPGSGSLVTLSGANTSTATFTMPAYTGSVAARRRTFKLTVTDSMGPSFAVTQTVNFNPNKAPLTPVISTSGDRKVFHSDSSTTSTDKSEVLSVSTVTDPDGDPLTLSWTVESAPTPATGQSALATSVLLSATSGQNITFKSTPKPNASAFNTAGVYTIGVTATDGVEQSAKATVDLLVINSWASDVYPIVTTSCGTTVSGCHYSSGPGGGLIMSGGAGNALTNLLNGRVTPNNHANSSFWTKVDSGAMPKFASKLPQQQINMIRDWIEPEYNASTKPGLSPGAENN